MPVSWNQFTPANVREAWKNGNNLKPSCTTSSYDGGNPSSAADLKRSIVDASGNIKKGLTTADDTALKPSVLALAGEQPIVLDGTSYYVPNHANGGIQMDPNGGEINAWVEYSASDDQKWVLGGSAGGNTRLPGLGKDNVANLHRLFAHCADRTNGNTNLPAVLDQRVHLRLVWDTNTCQFWVDEATTGSLGYTGPFDTTLTTIFGGWNLNNASNASRQWVGTIYRITIQQNNGANWDTNVDGWGELNGALPPP